jgi:(1->4)-alpha-D-glucan 1-alpha-D-glucosylmutase
MTAPAAAPRVATYRLQLHAGFTFADAAAIAPYLADLGISHLYLSPILQAVPGSMHGYDQCDPTRVSDDLGGETGFRRLVAAARGHHLGIVLDIVPNHMATHASNPWWWELLAAGREGRAGTYFDIDWSPGDPNLDGRVLLPVLGRGLEGALDAGELRLGRRDGAPVVEYFEQRFPLRDVEEDVATLSREILDRQAYVLAGWREGAARLNYRRFFDINTLVALREEDPAVFAAVHDLPLRMVEQDQVQGLRLDHVDGLRDPAGYLESLRRRAPGAWLLVEKILEPGERLPESWPVDGTTGYDFIHRLQGVFVDSAAEASMTALYTEFTGQPADFHEVVRTAKLEAAQRLFGSDVARLERGFARVAATRGVGGSRDQRAAALTALAVCLPVYRTYLRPGAALPAIERDRLELAARQARELDPGLDAALVDLLLGVLTGDVEGEEAADLTMRFQQFSGPLMAKGVEDTAFYRYNRLVSLNEVGGDPAAFGVGLDEFHSANLEALRHHPAAMLASSTHDTKRSEDVRARLSLLAQVPGDWAAAVRRWSAMNQAHRSADLPDRNAEYLLYQTLVGAWPLDEDRAVAYMKKAAREAKQHTTWTDPDAGYEDALRGFVRGVCRDGAFQADLRAFVEPLVAPGRTVSLAMALLKLTAPGVPDIYQGSETWDLSLVDPDNRRPVDYAVRQALLRQQLAAVRSGGDYTTTILAGPDTGLSKLHVVAEALRTRRNCAAAFQPGSTYTPLRADGSAAANAVAFARGSAEDPMMVVVAVPRLTLGSQPAWSATTLQLGPGEWTNELDGRPICGPQPSLADLFERFPVALLERAR